jgi:acetoin utilization deacetylase AcuC-like enzyme
MMLFPILLILITFTAGLTNSFSPSLQLPIKIYYDSSNHLHRDIQFHPEQPARIDACVKALLSFLSKPTAAATTSATARRPYVLLLDVAITANTIDEPHCLHEPFSEIQLEYAKQMLVAAHSEELVESIEMKCTASRDRRLEEGKDALGFIGYLDHDTFLTTETFHVCLRAAACWVECVNQVLSKKAAFGFALTRPPGHHATRLLPNGFCTFNFAAAAALHAIRQDNCQRVSIIDWDVHYGQGVADIVEGYSNIRYVSMHQVPAFPNQGEQRGVSGRYQNIMTVPGQPDSTWTCGYRELFTEKVLPFCSSSEWKPDLVIVCAGYDALGSDELASCSLNA